jgi:hypothetical protein
MAEIGGPDQDRFFDGLAGVVINDRAVPYVGTFYDRVMCSGYQALDAAARGDLQTARVLCRRAQASQANAEKFFAQKNF